MASPNFSSRRATGGSPTAVARRPPSQDARTAPTVMRPAAARSIGIARRTTVRAPTARSCRSRFLQLQPRVADVLETMPHVLGETSSEQPAGDERDASLSALQSGSLSRMAASVSVTVFP